MIADALIPGPTLPVQCECCRRWIRTGPVIQGRGIKCARAAGLVPRAAPRIRAPVMVPPENAPTLFDPPRGESMPTMPDPWRTEEWSALPDECLIAGCDSDDIDQRGPVWVRHGDNPPLIRKACSPHWEAIHLILGDQASWERTDGARQASA